MAPTRDHSQLKPFAFLLIYKKEKKNEIYFTWRNNTSYLYWKERDTGLFIFSYDRKRISKNENDHSLSLNTADNGSTFLKNKGEKKMKIWKEKKKNGFPAKTFSCVFVRYPQWANPAKQTNKKGTTPKSQCQNCVIFFLKNKMEHQNVISKYDFSIYCLSPREIITTSKDGRHRRGVIAIHTQTTTTGARQF
jgi:hypothetical protein